MSSNNIPVFVEVKKQNKTKKKKKKKKKRDARPFSYLFTQ